MPRSVPDSFVTRETEEPEPGEKSGPDVPLSDEQRTAMLRELQRMRESRLPRQESRPEAAPFAASSGGPAGSGSSDESLELIGTPRPTDRSHRAASGSSGSGFTMSEGSGSPGGSAGGAPVPVQPEESGFQTAITDSHMHPTGYSPAQVIDLRNRNLLAPLIPLMDKAGIHRTVVMALPTFVASQGCAHHPLPEGAGGLIHGQHYYLSQGLRTGGEPMTPAALGQAVQLRQYAATHMDDAVAHDYQLLPPEHQARIDPMMTGFDLGDHNSYLIALLRLRAYPNVFRGIGEITWKKEAVDLQVP